MDTRPRIAFGTIDLIKRMALDNRLWGAERIRGELLKLGIRVSKRTIQRSIRSARGPRPWGQSWSTFVKNHAKQIWACDFLQTYDIFFRPVFAFFIVDHGSRGVVHVGVTRAPTSRWTAQQRRNATPFGQAPRVIIRDNEHKFGVQFDRVARASVPESKLAASDAPAIYAMRWEIELLFRELKTQVRAHQMPSGNKAAVEVLLYASLLALAVARTLHRLLATTRRGVLEPFPTERWTGLVALVAHALLELLLAPPRARRPLGRRILILLRREGPDPNFGRLHLKARAQLGLLAR